MPKYQQGPLDMGACSGRGSARVIRRRFAAFGFAALIVAGCAAAPTSQGGGGAVDAELAKTLKAEGQVQVIDNAYSSSSLQAALVTNVLKKFGGDAEVLPFANIAASFVPLSKQQNVVNPEIWKILYQPQFKQYVDEEKSAEVVAKSGLTGEEGWYVPTYVVKGDPARGIAPTCPGLPDYKALNDCVNVFKTAQTGDKGQYMSGAEAWGPYYGDPQRIQNLGLNYTVKFAGSEAALAAEWTRAYDRGVPFLGLMWKPHYIALKYDLTRVEFPPYTPECWGTTYACNWGEPDIYSLVSKGFAQQHPAAMKILKNYRITDKDMRDMMTSVEEKGMSPDKAAQAWMDANQAVWQAWGSSTS